MLLIGNAAAVIARALVPVIGVVVLHWSAPKLLLIYFADTAAAYYVVLASMVLARDKPDPQAPGATEAVGARLRRQARAVLLPLPTLALMGAFFGILPLFVMIDLQDVLWTELLADRTLWRGVALQFALALSIVVERSSRRDLPASGAITAATTAIAVRWIAMIFIGFFLAPGIPRVVYGPLLIAVYAVMTAALELAPYRVLDWARRIAGPPPSAGKRGKHAP